MKLLVLLRAELLSECLVNPHILKTAQIDQNTLTKYEWNNKINDAIEFRLSIKTIDRYTDKLILIQFCNTLEQNINHKPFRELPLNGSIDIRMLINKAKMSGYNGYFEFELFNKDLRGRSVKSIIKKASEQFFRIINYE